MNKEFLKEKDIVWYLFQSKFLLVFSSPLLGPHSHCFQLLQYRKWKISNAINLRTMNIGMPL